MPKKVRCKFMCTRASANFNGTYGDEKKVSISFDYKFHPQYSSDENSENKTFWSATPAGEFYISCAKKQDFKVGKFYYIDIQEAVTDKDA